MSPASLGGAQDRPLSAGRFCERVQSFLAEQAAGGEDLPSPTQPILEVRRGWGGTQRGGTGWRGG